jgi:hypothetical protein
MFHGLAQFEEDNLPDSGLIYTLGPWHYMQTLLILPLPSFIMGYYERFYRIKWIIINSYSIEMR